MEARYRRHCSADAALPDDQMLESGSTYAGSAQHGDTGSLPRSCVKLSGSEARASAPDRLSSVRLLSTPSLSGRHCRPSHQDMSSSASCGKLHSASGSCRRAEQNPSSSLQGSGHHSAPPCTLHMDCHCQEEQVRAPCWVCKLLIPATATKASGVSSQLRNARCSSLGAS